MSPHDVDRVKWAQMTIFEQMGNIYSEVGRSLAAHRAGDQVRFEQALIRALDLFDATTECLIRETPFRAKEILRAKDQYLQLFFGDSTDSMAAASLERYFFNFALAARRHR